MIAGLRADISSLDLPNTNLECHPLNRNARLTSFNYIVKRDRKPMNCEYYIWVRRNGDAACLKHKSGSVTLNIDHKVTKFFVGSRHSALFILRKNKP
jgi:hypothetical protein